MIIADTSVWVDHFRRGNPLLAAHLDRGAVWMHAWIIGELALGGLKNRKAILTMLSELPKAPVCEAPEVLSLIDAAGLSGRGIGLVDAHLLASARLIGCALWTQDRKLANEAERLGLGGRLD